MTKFLSVAAVLALSSMILSNTGFAASPTASDKAYAAAMETMMQGMMEPATGKPDLDFVAGMIPHHEGAVAMAKVEKEFGKDPELLKLADAIIAAQMAEITVMKGWLSNKKLETAKASPEAQKSSAAGMEKMMSEMMKPTIGKADIDFANGMIPHHQGAIDMANVVLKFGADADVKTLADGVVKAQTSEITFMKDWLSTHAK